jgi:hypothetical protein
MNDGIPAALAFAAEALLGHVVDLRIAILPRQSHAIRIRLPQAYPNI